MTTVEDADMATHIAQLREIQNRLHVMGSPVPDADFAMLILTSLPDSWDSFTTAFLGSTKADTLMLSQELTSILIDEDRH